LGLNPGPFTLQGTNTYLIGNGRRRLLIDTGEGHDGMVGTLIIIKLNYFALMLCSVLVCLVGWIENLSKTMKDEGIEGLDGILITHWHHDHIGGIDHVRKRFGNIPVHKMVLPSLGARDAASCSHSSTPTPIPTTATAATAEDMAQKAKGGDEPTTFDWLYTPLKDGQVFQTEGATLTAMHTPGE
jgi:glyoxylase-like metal-dependent hydrolase (beta-lactamase superfamily II)